MEQITKRKKLADRLRDALEEGIEYAKGNVTLVESHIPITRTYTGAEVLSIREQRQLSQSRFAHLLGVSVRTLQSWEQGVRKPSGPALRLLQIFDSPEAFRPLFVKESAKAYSASKKTNSK